MRLWPGSNIMQSIHRYGSAFNQECEDSGRWIIRSWSQKNIKTATGNIPNTVMADHTLFTFPDAKAFANGKIKMCEMWVERLQMSGFPRSVHYDILHCFPREWLDSQFSPRLYRTTRDSLNDYNHNIYASNNA